MVSEVGSQITFQDDGETRYGRAVEIINNKINMLFDRSSFPPPLKQAISYSLVAGGKRLRPALALMTAEDLGIKGELALTAGLAIELLHNASLIHDDLPALDNDEMRRGLPTCHVKFGEATALLAGDLLSVYAIQLVLDDPLLRPEVSGKVASAIAKAYADLCCGQQLDLMPKSNQKELDVLYAMKTGALFRASLLAGGFLAGLPSEALTACGEIGEQLGIFFQISDDFIDIYGSVDVRGRVESSDQRNSKDTYFLGFNPSSSMELLNKRRDALLEEISSLETLLERELLGLKFILARIDQRFQAVKV